MLRLALITDKENQTYIESLQMAVEIEIYIEDLIQ